MGSENGFVGGQGRLSDSPSPFHQHRYNTRSSRDRATETRQQPPNPQKQYPRPINTTIAKPLPLSSRSQAHHHLSAPTQNDPTQIDSDGDQDPATNDGMMLDQILYTTTSNPLRAPFPSPAIKSSQPFYPFPPSTQGFGFSGGGQQQEMSWNGSSNSGAGGAGPGILVEAANRAQMAILVDDMGSMGIEQQMEQT